MTDRDVGRRLTSSGNLNGGCQFVIPRRVDSRAVSVCLAERHIQSPVSISSNFDISREHLPADSSGLGTIKQIFLKDASSASEKWMGKGWVQTGGKIMKTHRTLFGMRFIIILIATTIGSAIAIVGQPTAIGPSVNTTQAGELSYFTLKVGVKAKTLDIVNLANAALAADGRSARVSLVEIKGFRPRRMDTVFHNRPNSIIVRTPFIVRLEVKIPVVANRFIGIPIDLDTACDGWQTGQGKIVVRVQPGPPSFEGGSIIEDMLQVRNYVDSLVKNNFPQLNGSTAPMLIADPRCRNLGVTDFGTVSIEDDAIHFDRPVTRPTRPIGRVLGAFVPSVEVRFDRLKRLVARDLQGGVLYKDVEQIALNAYANYDLRQKLLTMREGEEVALDMPPVILSAGLYDKLVVLGHVEQPPNNERDTDFRTALRQQNFQPGTYVLRIPKYYTRPADRISPRPTFVRVDAYELTYTVKYVDTAVVR